MDVARARKLLTERLAELEVDGEPIDDARLEARPEAELCLRHQLQVERHGAP